MILNRINRKKKKNVLQIVNELEKEYKIHKAISRPNFFQLTMPPCYDGYMVNNCNNAVEYIIFGFRFTIPMLASGRSLCARSGT